MKRIKPISEKHLDFNNSTMLAMGLDGGQIVPHLKTMDTQIEKIFKDGTLTEDAKILRSFEVGKKQTDFAMADIIKQALSYDSQITQLKSSLYSAQMQTEGLSTEQTVLLPNVLNSFDPKKGISRNKSQQRMLLALEANGLIEGISPRLDGEYSPDTLEAIAKSENDFQNVSRLQKYIKNYVQRDLNEPLAAEIKLRQVN